MYIHLHHHLLTLKCMWGYGSQGLSANIVTIVNEFGKYFDIQMYTWLTYLFLYAQNQIVFNLHDCGFFFPPPISLELSSIEVVNVVAVTIAFSLRTLNLLGLECGRHCELGVPSTLQYGDELTKLELRLYQRSHNLR